MQVLHILPADGLACQAVHDMLHHPVAARLAPSSHLPRIHMLARRSCVFVDLQQRALVGPLAGWGHIARAGIARGLIEHWEGSLAEE